MNTAGLDWGMIPWGAGHHDAYRRLHDRITGLVAICEDLPEEHNTVTLDPDLTDANGIPAPKISYTLSANSIRMLEHGCHPEEHSDEGSARSLFLSFVVPFFHL